MFFICNYYRYSMQYINNECECFIIGSRHRETKCCFEVFGTCDETRSTRFDMASQTGCAFLNSASFANCNVNIVVNSRNEFLKTLFFRLIFLF